MTKRLIRCFSTAWRPSCRTTLWLLRLMIPITLTVRLMQHFGIIAWMAQWLDPVFSGIGLPGYSAIAFLTGAFVTTYASIAVMFSMALTLREATIIAIMVCICHALFLESAVIHKTGSNPLKMGAIRVVAAFVCGAYLNWVLPDMPQALTTLTTAIEAPTLTAMLTDWLTGMVKMALMIWGLIYALMALQRVLDDLGIMYKLVTPLRPVMQVFGLPGHAAYLWLVGNVLGLSYGSAIMLDLEESGQISREDANEVNYHLIMNHSMLEDTLVFAAIGIPALWILSTRVMFALALVWTRKLIIRNGGKNL